MQTKQCSHCHQTKLLAAFSKNKNNRDGKSYLCKECMNEYYRRDKQRHNFLSCQSALRLKQEVLVHYSGGTLACVHCGFADIRALSVDHIDGGGCQHRKKVNSSGIPFYRQLRKQGYPKGYQTLCMNCQFVKRVENKEYRQKHL